VYDASDSFRDSSLLDWPRQGPVSQCAQGFAYSLVGRLEPVVHQGPRGSIIRCNLDLCLGAHHDIGDAAAVKARWFGFPPTNKVIGSPASSVAMRRRSA